MGKLRMDGYVGTTDADFHWEEVAAADKALGKFAEAAGGEVEVTGAE